jgi:hypothetical protein
MMMNSIQSNIELWKWIKKWVGDDSKRRNHSWFRRSVSMWW